MLRLIYLGVSGFLLVCNGTSVLTAPFFSNPPFGRVALGKIAADPVEIERRLPDVTDVCAIIVGHAHYDHLLDVPYIAREKAKQALIYGNRTMKHILAPFGIGTERMVALDDRASTHDIDRGWIYVPGSRVRLLPIRSGHAPQALGVLLYPGGYDSDLERIPQWTFQWKCGLPLAYLIDFLNEEGEPVFRVFYQDSACRPPLGFPPPLADRDTKQVDVAILCAASFNQTRGYPQEIVRFLRPKNVVVCHWEDFFRPAHLAPKVVPFFNRERFMGRLRQGMTEETDLFWPKPGDELFIAAR